MKQLLEDWRSSTRDNVKQNESYFVLTMEKRARMRAEMKQLLEVWRSCTRDNVEADESDFVSKK